MPRKYEKYMDSSGHEQTRLTEETDPSSDTAAATAVEDRQEAARKAITSKDAAADSSMPTAPDTKGMSLAEAAAANAAHQKRLQAWRSRKMASPTPSPSPSDQAKALRK